jgi:hypothetical protein
MNELIAYILLPGIALGLLLNFLNRRYEAEAKVKEEAERAMRDYEKERIEKLARIDLGIEERARKKEAEEGRSKNPLLRSLGLRKIRKD